MDAPNAGWIERMIEETVRGGRAFYRPAHLAGPAPALVSTSTREGTMMEHDVGDLVTRLQSVMASGRGIFGLFADRKDAAEPALAACCLSGDACCAAQPACC